MADLKRLYESILYGDAKGAAAVTQEALAEGLDPQELLSAHVIPAMNEVGRRFEAGDYFVPEMLISARAMKAAFALIRPLLAQQGAEPTGRVAIGTVKGDLHDIGKNLVAAMLEGGGFEVFDLGVDVSPDRFIAAVKEKRASIVCLSALLTTTMPSMKTTVEALQQAGLRERVKVMIGGAPVTREYAVAIGADAYGENAGVAVKVARRLAGASSAAEEGGVGAAFGPRPSGPEGPSHTGK